jgi:hypothetical protein
MKGHRQLRLTDLMQCKNSFNLTEIAMLRMIVFSPGTLSIILCGVIHLQFVSSPRKIKIECKKQKVNIVSLLIL